ncbi:MAG: LysM peptidoglycan-binding domain-containing protein [Paucibacter sp.]|nr:LysM peptidoglycan-binding domain-containing protein [Roseateles sp.]
MSSRPKSAHPSAAARQVKKINRLGAPRRFLVGSGVVSALVSASLLSLNLSQTAWAADLTVTPQQRSTANEVAQSGVPLSELAPNAPDSYTVKSGDTLWDLSKLFLKSPWRWPELWGMNQAEIQNPHRIYPGQVLVLVKVGDRASLRVGHAVNGSGSSGGEPPVVKLSPQARVLPGDDNAIAAIPLHLIEPFLNEAVVFQSNELAAAPRIIATKDDRIMMTRGDTAYARGDLKEREEYRIFRKAEPLRAPVTHGVLGYEARYLGTADVTQSGKDMTLPDGKAMAAPATLVIKQVREEVGPGDRLALVPQRSFNRYVPHAPNHPVSGSVVSLYGDALVAGQNEIVSINRGSADGMERGHVLALLKAGALIKDKTGTKPEMVKLPDEKHGILFVFQVYERVSYALIISVQEPVGPGDRFSEP